MQTTNQELQVYEVYPPLLIMIYSNPKYPVYNSHECKNRTVTCAKMGDNFGMWWQRQSRTKWGMTSAQHSHSVEHHSLQALVGRGGYNVQGENPHAASQDTAVAEERGKTAQQ